MWLLLFEIKYNKKKSNKFNSSDEKLCLKVNVELCTVVSLHEGFYVSKWDPGVLEANKNNAFNTRINFKISRRSANDYDATTCICA